ncbi:hypothetical protein [Actinokineospora iranica]|uniref:Uncharacterized protein n=1 Tax=Actinokineospora iranica TaxID=1271860 RepID=A0A1G6LE22_9PSEU|nr:hypothetical protein [Actinokineospora iranica]SDC41508.1 hypothetical protein SAMN05216174_10225 [Actinokineospora iranica]
MFSAAVSDAELWWFWRASPDLDGVDRLDADQRVFAFVVVGDAYYPQAPCVRATESGELWRCDTLRDPPAKPGTRPESTAVVVPVAAQDDLSRRAAAGEPMARDRAWGVAVPVPVP